MTFLYLYSFMGFACLKLVTPDFGLLAKVEYALEGAFRYIEGSCFVSGIVVAAVLLLVPVKHKYAAVLPFLVLAELLQFGKGCCLEGCSYCFDFFAGFKLLYDLRRHAAIAIPRNFVALQCSSQLSLYQAVTTCHPASPGLNKRKEK